MVNDVRDRHMLLHYFGLIDYFLDFLGISHIFANFVDYFLYFPILFDNFLDTSTLQSFLPFTFLDYRLGRGSFLEA